MAASDKPVSPCNRCKDRESLKTHCRADCERYAAFDAERKAYYKNPTYGTPDSIIDDYTAKLRMRIKRWCKK